MHSNYSDGTWPHRKIAEAGMDAGVDGLIITDHNVLIHGVENYFQKNRKKIIVLVGEEIHNKSREPQKSHLITFGQSVELCNYAENIQHLLHQVKKSGGLSFIAHPFEKALPQVNETDITWEDWEVSGFNGIEIWNHLSELKNESSNWIKLLFYVFNPAFYGHGPHPMAIQKWDELLISGKKTIAVGGSDAHRLVVRKGLIKKLIFPYQFHFRSINNHILTRQPFTGNFSTDRKIILEAFQKGNLFIGYDLPACTKGFRFYAQGKSKTAIMGEEIKVEKSITFQIRLPEAVECRLIHDGTIIKTWSDQEICTFITKSPGVYRVECYIQFLGKRRGWIFSNPIYVVGD